MTGWVEIALVAFVTQLAVLPGEKVQVIIAGLSTRYDPWVVVGAASSAFAGWTALEILFGRALQRTLSPGVLDVVTGVLFVVFAVLLVGSAPSAERATGTGTAGGGETGEAPDVAEAIESHSVLGLNPSGNVNGFVPIFAMMAAGEFGDKTQLVTIGLAVQYGATSAIWVGEMLAIVPVSLLNAFFFHRFSHTVDLRRAHLAAAGLFVLFALDIVLQLAVDVSLWERFVAAVAGLV